MTVLCQSGAKQYHHSIWNNDVPLASSLQANLENFVRWNVRGYVAVGLKGGGFGVGRLERENSALAGLLQILILESQDDVVVCIEWDPGFTQRMPYFVCELMGLADFVCR
jgi:hypothetical protein